MQHILKAYLKRLTNLNSGNKSLLLLNLPAEQFFDLHELDFLLNKPSFDLIAQLIAGKSNLHLCDVQDSRFDRVNIASQKLKKISRTEQFIEEERGAQDLYVGYPLIRGKLSDGTLIRCPLLFFPVRLGQQSNRWVLERRDEELLTLNKSFLLAYAYFNKVTVPDELIETSFEEFDADSRLFRTQLYELLKNSPLEINFNPDVLADKLQSFEKFTKADFESLQRTGELKLFPEAVLGIFPQAGSYLVPDYRQLIEESEAGTLDDFFRTGIPEQPVSPPAVREEHTFTPFAIDASQENALRRVKQGQSMVVQGPPGTGKSQLICNLIADFIARGKRVLLVCQKRVALDVVYERLKEGGMADFVALVHDFKSDRKTLYEQITRQIDRTDAYREQNNSLDAIFMERTFLQESRRIDKISAELEEFRQALFSADECGLSAKELYLTSNPALPAVNLGDVYTHFPFTTSGHYRQALAHYEAYAPRYERDDYPWKERISFSRFTQSDLDAILQTLAGIPPYQESCSAQFRAITGREAGIPEISAANREVPALRELLDTVQTPAQWAILRGLQNGAPAGAADEAALRLLEEQLLRLLSGEGVETSTPAAQVEAVQPALQKARRARANWFSWTYWQLFSPERALVRSLAEANQLLLTPAGLETLSRTLANRQAADALYARLDVIRPLAPRYDAATVRHWFADQYQAIRAASVLPSIAFLRQYPELLQTDLATFRDKTGRLFALLAEIQAHRASWKNYLTEAQIRRILAEPTRAELLAAVLKEDFDVLSEIDQIKDGMSLEEQVVTERLWQWVSAPPANAGPDLPAMTGIFENSIRLAWIEHLERKYPVLRGASTLKIRQLENDLQASVAKKMQLSRESTLLKLREQTYRDVEFNRLNNMVTYRELRHQTSKKRKVWQMRKLLTAFSGDIFRLIPCWMASPESVSAVFGMEKLFDLVVFDEASQCFAERGIPAIYRGRQVVVTGDSRQLSPSDLYRIRFDEETDETPALEIDSLLDLAAQYFPQTQLNGHYRSKSLELIDFSNRHFYGQHLQLLPDRHELNRAEPAIKYQQVEGIWENNVNPVEAGAVVELVAQLTRERPDKEIGIVTFNFKQQNLIQDLLEEAAEADGRNWPETLFVKNIENVQGDERDIIIFSVGYAPDAKGRMVMQFGSLNLPGGENRLNVAVTRAREQIYVISSILPAQLRTEGALHPGPRLLKQYLEYARQVSGGTFVPRPLEAKEFANSQLLKHHLLRDNAGYHAELPFADLTVKSGSQYESLILTDDDLYYRSVSAKDAHAYTPFLLRKKNWPFTRLYSREYWKDQEKLSRGVAAEPEE